MDSRYAGWSAVTLRNKIVDETQKFILSLQFSAPLSDLEEIREKIRLLTEALTIKEKQEQGTVEKNPQSISPDHNQFNGDAF